MRHVILGLVLALPLFVACSSAESETDSGNVTGAASAQEDGRTAGGFDARGKLTPGENFSFHFIRGNTTVVAFDAVQGKPMDVVFASDDQSEVRIDVHGPFNVTTGKFGPLLESSQLVRGEPARVRGFVAPETGIYVVLAKEISDKASNYMALVQPSTSKRLRFELKTDVHGARIRDDVEAQKRSWEAACADWKTRMMTLSGNHLDHLDCGAPRDDRDHTLGSRARAVLAAKLGEGEGDIAAPAVNPPDTLAEDGAALTAVGTDGSTSEMWTDACFSRLTGLKTKFGDRFLGGGCSRTGAVGVRAGDRWVETWSGSVTAYFRR